MSLKLTNHLRSYSFKQLILVSVAIQIVGILAITINGMLVYSKMIQSERRIIQEELEWIIEVYKEDGPNFLIDEFSEDDPAIWDNERLQTAAWEHGLVWQMRNPQNQVVLGIVNFRGKPGWSRVKRKVENKTFVVEVFTVKADDGYVLSLGKFHHPTIKLFKQQQIRFIVLYLFITVIVGLLLSLIIAKRQQRRIAILNSITDNIGAGEVNTRLPITKRHDEIDKFANSVNTMVDHLQSLQRNIDAVSVGIAHDLKTPVTQLDGRLQLMEQDMNHPAALEQHIGAARQHVARILDTFQALLRLGEIEAGQRQQHFQCFDLSGLLKDIAESYQPVFEDAEKSLDVSILEDITVHGDADLITQMVINLLENSIQHSKPNAKAWLRLQMSKEGVVLQVGDNGDGIPEKDASSIFDRFYRVDKSRTKSSNGLGLSLVKSICDLHGAEIFLLPNQKGAVFDIYLSVNMRNSGIK